MTTQGYFGTYFTGSTFASTGDWAVMSDDRQSVDYFSLNDFHNTCLNKSYKGQIWMSLDGPCTGLWVLQMKKEYSLFPIFKNVLLDSCTDRYG